MNRPQEAAVPSLASRSQRLAVASAVVAMNDYSRICRVRPGSGGFALSGHPQQGQMVLTGMQVGAAGASPEKRIGFCVQVRLGRGQFHSDMVFLRHPDGSLTTHENQSYYAMSPEQEALARTLFKVLPEDEDYAPGYICRDKIREVGFLIADSKSRPSPDTPFSVTFEGGDSASGKPRKTITTHI